MNLLSPSTVVGGRYKVLAPFDSGQLLECYLAVDTQTNKQVRIYIFAPSEVPGEKSMLHLEGELAKRKQLSHQGLLRILDIGRYELEGGTQTVYYISEHAEEISLSERISKLSSEPLKFGELISLVNSIAEALGALHAERLSASNLDPKSILVNENHQARLPAFMFISSAQWLRDKSAVCRRSGTNYRYIAPEMICDSGAMVGDEKSDIYLLGILAYELGIGTVPFEGTTETMSQMHRSEPVPDLVKQSGLPEWYDKLVKDCMEKVAVYRPFIGNVIGELSQRLSELEDEAREKVLEYPERNKLNILFVEDNKLDQLFISRLVRSERWPFRFHFAPSIERAGKLVKSTEFSVIVSDYILPDGTALDLLRKHRDIPTIVVTGSDLDEVRPSVISAGAYDCIGKEPGQRHLSKIPTTVAKVLELGQLRRELGVLKLRLESTLGAIREALSTPERLVEALQKIEAELSSERKEEEHVRLG